ncbi:MAG: hypothetical protein GVY36_11385 [Verrucomicrobia bacterium]|jgi:hypothetical protein|nr:hypothetical protein [Verrucomicrobiota bacterium]
MKATKEAVTRPRIKQAIANERDGFEQFVDGRVQHGADAAEWGPADYGSGGRIKDFGAIKDVEDGFTDPKIQVYNHRVSGR